MLPTSEPPAWPPTGQGAAAIQAEARFRGLLQAAPDAIVVVDAGGRIVLVNTRTEVLFGYTANELVGHPIEMLIPQRFRGAHVGERSAYTKAPHARPMGVGLQLSGLRKDGSEVPVEISLSPVQTDGELLVMSAIRDTTERRRTEETIQKAREEAERANRAKSEFLSRMSHELRTPLNAVLGFAQLLEMDELTPQQEKGVGHILKAGRHLLDLINEVLDIARIESGRLSLSPEPVRVVEIGHEAIDLVRPLADEHQVMITMRENADAGAGGAVVLADRQRLKQVLLNLLSNAVKYNYSSGKVELGCSYDGEGHVLIAVRDSGRGIAPDQREGLFVPFDRLGAEATEVEGTGLGLALSKGLIEAMHGTIAVESTPGEGSVFTVELPAAITPLDQLHEVLTVPASTELAGALKRKTVLYVEDNLPNLELIEQIFARWPHVELIPAMQGRLGLDIALRHAPDLVLLDLHLPDIGGLEVLKAFQADPRTQDVPVVIVSADATQGQIERLLAAGARTYLTKPLDVPRFLRLVGELLETNEQ